MRCPAPPDRRHTGRAPSSSDVRGKRASQIEQLQGGLKHKPDQGGFVMAAVDCAGFLEDLRDAGDGTFRQIKNALRAITVEVMIKTRISRAEAAELIPAQGMRAAAKVDTPEFIAAGNGIPLRRQPGQVPRIGGARDFRYYQSGRTLSTVSTARSAFSQLSGV